MAIISPPAPTLADFRNAVLVRSRHRVAALGDSQTAGNHSITPGSVYQTSSNGYLVMLSAILGNRLKWSQNDNYGVPGDRFVQMEPRVPALIASDVGTCFFHGGTNDALYIARYASTTTAQILSEMALSVASMLRSLDAIRKAGILVFLIPPQQRTTAAWTSVFGLTTEQVPIARRITVAIRDAMIREARLRRDVVLADPTTSFVDVTGGPRTSYTYDGTHYSGLGALAMAQAMAPIVATYIPPVYVPTVDLADVADAIFPRGNLLSNGLMAGSGVAVSTAPLTGNTVNSWGAQQSGAGTPSSGTAVLSVVTRPDGLGQGVRLVATNLVGTATTAYLGIGQTVTLPNDYLASGDILTGACAFSVASGSVGLKGVQVRISELNGSGSTVDIAGPAIGAYALPLSGVHVFETPQFPIRASGGAGARSVTLRLFAALDLMASGGASCDVTFWAPALRKIA